MDQKNAVYWACITPLPDTMNKKAKGRSNQSIVILAAVWLVMIAGLVPCNSGSAQPTQTPSSTAALASETPAIDGGMLLDTRCSVCHTADRPKKAKKTPEQWEQTVSRMMSKGAKLTDAERMVLVDYLSRTYGP